MIVYLIAGLGAAAGLYLMLEWWANADTPAAKRGLLIGAIVLSLILALALFSRAGPVAAVMPILFTGFRLFRGARMLRGLFGGDRRESQGRSAPPAMTREQALEIMGLEGQPTDEEIRKRYRALIAKAHPDAGGSQWLAAQINEAKVVLLKERS